jgi:hypothetical protein
MAYSIFDWAKEVTYGKGNWNDFSEEDKLSFNPYMLNKVLSMNQNYIELVAGVQQLWLITHEQLYNIYKQLLPKERVWSKYIKSTRDKSNDEVVQAVAQYYQVSNREAKQYLRILSQEEQIKILQSLGKSNDEVENIYGRQIFKLSKGNDLGGGESNSSKKRGRPRKNS